MNSTRTYNFVHLLDSERLEGAINYTIRYPIEPSHWLINPPIEFTVLILAAKIKINIFRLVLYPQWLLINPTLNVQNYHLPKQTSCKPSSLETARRVIVNEFEILSPSWNCFRVEKLYSNYRTD